MSKVLSFTCLRCGLISPESCVSSESSGIKRPHLKKNDPFPTEKGLQVCALRSALRPGESLLVHEGEVQTTNPINLPTMLRTGWRKIDDRSRHRKWVEKRATPLTYEQLA